MNVDVVSDLRARFMPHLREFAARLVRDFPEVRVTTWESPTGSLLTTRALMSASIARCSTCNHQPLTTLRSASEFVA